MIIGNGVADFYNDFVAVAGVEGVSKDAVKQAAKKNQNVLQRAITAIAEILFGKENPSGRLAESFPKEANDCPAHTIGTFGKKDRVEYREGVMVGYRYYDTKKTDVLFPFGHGLSYTAFTYNDLEIIRQQENGRQTVHVILFGNQYRRTCRERNRSDLCGTGTEKRQTGS